MKSNVKYISLALALVLFISTSFSGCGTEKEQYKDDNYRIKLPTGWIYSDTSSDPLLKVLVNNHDNSMFAAVSIEGEIGQPISLEDYASAYTNLMISKGEDPLTSVITIPPTGTKMGSFDGFYSEIDITADGLPLHIWSFVFYANDTFVRISVTGLQSNTGENAETAKGIIDSIKVKKEK